MKTLDQSRTLYLFDPPYICQDWTYKEHFFNIDKYLELIQIIKQIEKFIFVSYESEFLKYIINNEFKEELLKE